MATTIKEQVDNIEKNVTRMATAMLGDEIAGVPGAIKNISDLKVRVEKIETALKKIKWFGLGTLFTGGMVGGYLGKGTALKFLIGFFFCLILFIIII